MLLEVVGSLTVVGVWLLFGKVAAFAPNVSTCCEPYYILTNGIGYVLKVVFF